MRLLGRASVVAGALVVAGAGAALAQDSQFGVRGLGTPGRWESVRARSTGGAFAAFDVASALADVALVDVRALTSTAMGAASYRSVASPGGDANLRNQRFPLFTVAGPISSRLMLGGGYTTYLDDSYEIATHDSVLLRGAMVPFTDAYASDGGVSDMRVAAAARLGSAVALGLGVHAITGSARVTATRAFADTNTYATVRDSQLVRRTGFGVSASARVNLGSVLSLVGFARTDGHFETKVDDVPVDPTDIPNTVGGAVRVVLSPVARAAGAVTWRSWSTAAPGASNTLNWSAGLELGSPGDGVRIGGRGGQLPFGPAGVTPSEWGLAAGLGRTFSAGHGVIDVGIERLARSGGGLHETVWTMLVGLTILQ